MSLTNPGSGDVGLGTSRDAYADDSEDEDPVSNYQRDEAIFAEDPFSQHDTEPYVTFCCLIHWEFWNLTSNKNIL